LGVGMMPAHADSSGKDVVLGPSKIESLSQQASVAKTVTVAEMRKPGGAVKVLVHPGSPPSPIKVA